jgi:hypothetical protein
MHHVSRGALAALLFTPAIALGSAAGLGANEVGNVLPAEGIGDGHFSTLIQRGSPGYAWVKGFAGGQPLAEQVRVAVRYQLSQQPDDGQSLEHRIHSGQAAAAKNLIVPDGPVPETPGRDGITSTTQLFCTSVTIGTVGEIADIEYDWSWQYTRDADRDGTMDSDPDWVLVGIRITFLKHDVASMCP